MAEWRNIVKGLWITRRDAFRKCFSGNSGDLVLADLAKHCGWLSRNPPTDQLSMAYMEGRRDVFLHIRTQLDMSDDRIARIIDEQQRETDD